MAVKPEAHIVDDKAKAIFEEMLSGIATLSRITPDYGIDYRVQMLEGNIVGTKVFEAQMKGHNSFERHSIDGRFYIRQPLSTDRLSDYLAMRQVPVFLVAIDVNNRIARYIFMQQYPDCGRLPGDWRSQKTVTIYIPDENNLSDANKFRSDIESAIVYLNNKYPGTVSAAIIHAEQSYQMIDPRLIASWNIVGGKPTPHFTVKNGEKVDISINAIGSEASSKLKKAIESGLPMTFTQDEIQIIGSPLFDTSKFVGDITMSTGKTFDIILSLARKDNNGCEVARIDGIQGKMTIGKRDFSYEAKALDGLFEIKANGSYRENVGAEQHFQCHFCFRKWAGYPILHLPLFGKLKSVFCADANLSTHVIITIPGHGSISGQARKIQPEEMDSIAFMLQSIQKMREIAQMSKKSPLFRIDLTKEQFEDVKDIHEILTSGTRKKPLGNAKMKGTFTKDAARKLLEHKEMRDFAMITNRTIEFYKEPITIQKYICRFNVLIMEDREAIEKACESKDSEEIDISFVGIKESILEESIEFD